MTNMIEDLSALTSISPKAIMQLTRKLIYCLCETIEEDTIANNAISEINLGYGVLFIKHDDRENIRYKFVPTHELDKAVKNTVINKQNLLKDTLSESLSKKFMEVYKDLC